MMATLKTRLVAVSLSLCISLSGFSQWSDGPFISLAGQFGVPFNNQINPYTWAAGGFGKLSIPIGSNDYLTLSMNALSMNGKSKVSDKGLKEHDILSGLIGYRYDFRREDTYNYFFIEPQVGWTFSGTDYNTLSVLPMVGYSLNTKVDFGLWYHAAMTTQRWPRIGVAGVSVAYNFHFSRRMSE